MARASTAPQDSRAHLRQLTAIEDIVACCVALGATSTGGPLSVPEKQQVAWLEGLAVPKEFVEDLRGLILAGEDPLGEALCSMRSPVAKRALGAVYTPQSIASAMVSWVLGQGVTTVVDPGCGSGRFALEVARRERDVRIIAIDCDPVATLICRAGLATLGHKKCGVLQTDYLEADIVDIEGRTGFVGNPPYLRHHGIGQHQKEWGRGASARLGVPWSGLAGLHVLFMLATAHRMRPRDVVCFITSAEWLDVGYGKILRAMLTQQPRLQSIHILDPKAAVFSDVMTTATIFCAEQGAQNRSAAARALASPVDLLDLSYSERSVPLGDLSAATRWTRVIVHGRDGGPAIEGHVPLGSIARVSRGVATGANQFFVMTLQEASARGLQDLVRPVFTSAEEVFRSGGVLRVRPDTRSILDIPAVLNEDVAGHSRLHAFLAEGEKRGIPGRYLCRQRRSWWALSPRVPPIVATYMARRPPAFALNPDGAAILNVCHGIYPRLPLSDAQLRGLVLYLNSLGERLNGAGRTYQGGLQKFEPREMEAIPVPPLDELARIGADKT